MMRSFTLVLTAVALAAAPISAETIDFEDLPAANDPLQTLSEEYAHLGVHFSTTDDGATWSGSSAGDPGSWLLEGSKGPAFLGFDGRSYSAFLIFDAPVQEFRLDVARGNGAVWLYDFVMVAGMREGRIVEVAWVYPGGVNDWTTVALTEEVEKVYLSGRGLPGYRFGVDNIEWAGEDPDDVLVAEIDIRPGSETNPIGLKSRGVVPVVLFGAEDFAVVEIDASTLFFGPDEAEMAHRNGPHFAHVDGDGYLDLIAHFRNSSAGIGSEDSEACLQGKFGDGVAFEGCDVVNPTP
jgi:hypothetical protein